MQYGLPVGAFDPVTGKMLNYGRGGDQSRDGYQPARGFGTEPDPYVFRPLLSQAPAAPAPVAAPPPMPVPAARPMPAAPSQRAPIGMLTGGGAHNQQLLNMLRMFQPMTGRGMGGLSGLGLPMQGYGARYGMQQPQVATAAPAPTFADRYGRR